MKELLVSFEETLSPIFPKHWEVSEEIAVEFCRITREELGKVMRQRQSEIDVNLLLFAIQVRFLLCRLVKCAFEHSCQVGYAQICQKNTHS